MAFYSGSSLRSVSVSRCLLCWLRPSKYYFDGGAKEKVIGITNDQEGKSKTLEQQKCPLGFMRLDNSAAMQPLKPQIFGHEIR